MKKITSTIFVCFALIFNLNSQKSINFDNINLKSSYQKANLPAQKAKQANFNITLPDPYSLNTNTKIQASGKSSLNQSFEIKGSKHFTDKKAIKPKNNSIRHIRLENKQQNHRAPNDTILYASFPYYTASSYVDFNLIDNDGLTGDVFDTTSSWLSFYDTISTSGDTNIYFASTSYFTPSPGSADDWMIFDSLLIPSNGACLFWNHFFDNNKYRDGYQVLISKDNGVTYDTIMSFSDNDILTAGDTLWTGQSLNIDSSVYGGKYVNLAFRNVAYDMLWINIDDILVTEGYNTQSNNGTYDLNAYGIMKPDTNNYLANFTNDTIKLLILNEGDSIASNDSIDLTLTINSTTYGYNIYDFKVYNNQLDTNNMLILSISGFTTQNMLPGETMEVCFSISFPGDTNSSNDSYCYKYMIKPQVPSTCDTIIYQDFSSGLINNFYFDSIYGNSYIHHDVDSNDHHPNVTSAFNNASYSSSPSGFIIDSTLTNNDFYLMFNSYFTTPDTSYDRYGFVVDIPSNGAIFSWEHAFLNNNFRNSYGIVIMDYSFTSNYEFLEYFYDNDSRTDGDTNFVYNQVTIDSSKWGSKKVYLYIYHRSNDQLLVLFDNLMLRGDCQSNYSTCYSYYYISDQYDTACVSLQKITYPNGNIADSTYITIDSSGTYMDTVNTFGICMVQKTHITIYPKPDTLSIAGNSNTGINSVEYYSVSQTAGSTYNWHVTGGNIISGQSTNSIQVQWSSMGNGEVIVIETSDYGCAGDTNKLSITISPPVGISQKDMPQFNIVPNPVLNMATIYLNKSCMGAEFSIYDVLGNKISSIENISQPAISLNAVDYSKGIYFIVINNGAHTVKRKIFFK